jgi:hypothetical protein
MTVAFISGAVSLAAAMIALWSGRSVARLSSKLEEQRLQASKREQAEELRARYRDPLSGAVFDLQSRLYNIVAQDFLVRYVCDGVSSRAYAIENTLYVLAQYLAWVEIIRREIQFLDLGEEVADREWLAALEGVRDTLARDDIDPLLRVFRGDQRAIGEIVTVETQGPNGSQRLQSMGYAQFVDRLGTPSFVRWFSRLQRDVELLAAEPYAHLERVLLLQNKLTDVLEIFDPACRRFPAERRQRLLLSGQRRSTA